MLKQATCLLLILLFPVLLFAQQPDTTISQNDSLVVRTDSVIKPVISDPVAAYDTALQKVLKGNRFLNAAGKPVAMQNKLKERGTQDLFFYLMTTIVFLLAFFKFFYARYFYNMFRVFFNTSLRQGQLTDQLLQARLPSLFFNIFFTLTGGIYVYLLLRHFHWITDKKEITVMLSCVLCLGLIYFIKFLTLKFTGWLTGYKEVTNTYLFVIFLINKIVGIFMVPFVIIIAFSNPELVNPAILVSLLLIGLMLLLRFFRSYGLLQNQLKVSRFHFFIYIIGIEIMPLLLIYKSLVILLSKNL